MDCITKELFFNEMTEKYPESMKVFLKWIDGYKASVNWITLFNVGKLKYPKHVNEVIYNSPPKFHEMPFEMQFGIIATFMSVHEKMYRHMPCKMGTVMYRLENCLYKIQAQINQKTNISELQEIDLANIKRIGVSNNE